MWELISRGLAFVTLSSEVEGSGHREDNLRLLRVKETASLVLEIIIMAISWEQLSFYFQSIFMAGHNVLNHLFNT